MGGNNKREERQKTEERGMEENDGMGRRRRRRGRRGRSRGEAGARSVCSREESAAAAGQWTVSATTPNGHRAVSDILEHKVRLKTRSGGTETRLLPVFTWFNPR